METGQWSLLRQLASVGRSGAVDVGVDKRLTLRMKGNKVRK